MVLLLGILGAVMIPVLALLATSRQLIFQHMAETEDTRIAPWAAGYLAAPWIIRHRLMLRGWNGLWSNGG